MKSSFLCERSRFFPTLISILALLVLVLSFSVASPTDAAIFPSIGTDGQFDGSGSQYISGVDQTCRTSLPPAPSAMATCPSGCTCMTWAEAEKYGYQLCGGKKIICDYDKFKEPMYCFTKPKIFIPDIHIKPPPSPSLSDLHIRRVGLPIVGGGQYRVAYEIENFGPGSAASSHTGLYVDGVLQTESIVGTLAPGEQRELEFSFTYNLASCTSPTDTIRVVADSRAAIAETHEDNNEESLTFDCPEASRPDLHFRWVRTEPLGGSEHNILYQIENQGAGPAGFSQTAIYIDGVMEDEVMVDPLETGERREFSFTYDLSSCTEETDIIRLVIDSDRAVEETNELNNEESLTWNCPERPKPDLIIRNVWWEHDPGSLQNLYIRYSIENRSLASAGPSITGLWINYELISSSSVPALDGGEVLGMVTFPERWTPQVNDNRVQICADANGNVDEPPAGEGNNCLETDWAFEFSCCDRFQSGDEEGIDCGGSHCPPCNRCDLGTLPSRFDWRDYYALPQIRDQSSPQGCGSCWAHAAIGAIEGTYIVEQCGGTPDISEQNAICECPGGCGGGCPHDVLRRARNSGIVDESCQLYLASDSPCTKCSDWRDRLWMINEYHRVSSDIEDIKRALICYGPLSVGSESWEHAVVIVGYDDNMVWNDYDHGIILGTYGPGVWIIRNQWTDGWGYDNDGDGMVDDPGYGLIPYSGHSRSDIKNYVHYVRGVISP